MRALIIMAGIPFRALLYTFAGFILVLGSFIDVKMLDYWQWAEVKRKIVRGQ